MKKQFPSYFVLFIGALIFLSPMSANYAQPKSTQKNVYLTYSVGQEYSGKAVDFSQSKDYYREPQGSFADKASETIVGGIGDALFDGFTQPIKEGISNANSKSYSRAEEQSFMIALRNALIQNHLFDNCKLTSQRSIRSSQDVLITVFFKTTHVADQQDGYKITLDVDLIINKYKKPPFKRTYLVQSNPGGFFSTTTVNDQKIEVSQKLLDNLVHGIYQWQKAKH